MTYFIAFMPPLFLATTALIESFLSLDVFKRPIVMLFFVSLTNALFMPFVFLIGIPTLPPNTLWINYSVLAILDIAYLHPYYWALKKTDTSIVTALFTMGKIFVPLLSFFILKEILTPLQYFGFIIILSASIILNFNSKRKFHLNQSIYLMILSSFLLACRLILAKMTLDQDSSWLNILIYPSLISGLIPFLFLLFPYAKKHILHKLPVYRQKLKYFILIEFISFLAIICSAYGLSHLSPIMISAIEATEPIFMLALTLILSYFTTLHFRENMTHWFKKIICFILMILGVVFVC